MSFDKQLIFPVAFAEIVGTKDKVVACDDAKTEDILTMMINDHEYVFVDNDVEYCSRCLTAVRAFSWFASSSWQLQSLITSSGENEDDQGYEEHHDDDFYYDGDHS